MITIADKPYQELRVDLSRVALQLPPGEHRVMTIPAGRQVFADGAGVTVTWPGIQVCVAESPDERLSDG